MRSWGGPGVGNLSHPFPVTCFLEADHCSHLLRGPPKIVPCVYIYTCFPSQTALPGVHVTLAVWSGMRCRLPLCTVTYLPSVLGTWIWVTPAFGVDPHCCIEQACACLLGWHPGGEFLEVVLWGRIPSCETVRNGSLRSVSLSSPPLWPRGLWQF